MEDKGDKNTKTNDEYEDVNDVFNHGKSEPARIDGPVKLYYYQQYYSPMKAPSHEIEEFASKYKDKIELEKKLAQRFISSVIRREKHIFHHYLGTVKININDKGGQQWSPIMFAIQKKRDYYVKHLLYSHSLYVVQNSKKNSQTTTTNKNTNIEEIKKHESIQTDTINNNNNNNKLEKLELYLKNLNICSMSPFAIDLQCKDPISQRSLMHLLCERGDAAILERILNDCRNERIITDKPLTIDDCDKNGQTAFYIACNKGFDDIVCILLDYGANPNICTNKDGTFGLLKASEKGHMKVVRALLNHNDRIIKRWNCNNGNATQTSLNLCKINERDARGRTALMVACAEDRRKIVQMLLNYGATNDSIENDEEKEMKGKEIGYERVDLNVTDAMNFDWNVLMWAVYRRNVKIVQMLLASHLPINFWHATSENEFVLDMCSRSDRLLRLEIWLTMMKRYFKPAISNAQIVNNLNVPDVIVDVLCSMLY